MKHELKNLFALLLIAILLLNGCNQPPTREQLMQTEEAREFLEKYPDATIQSNYFDESSFSLLQGYAPAECKNIPKKSYWRVKLISTEATLYLYLDSQTLKAECIQLEGGDECTKNEECKDSDETTKDICTGSPKKCVHEPKSCREQNGFICSEDEYCENLFIKASDSERCCTIECLALQTDPCEEIECKENEKCIEGECVLKTCAELEGIICPESEYCVLGFVESFDSERCCPGPCSETDPCIEIECAEHLKCVRGKCELKKCVERGGQICEENEICSTSYSNASDTLKCCLGICTEASPTPPLIVECQSDTECDDGLSFTLDKCAENTCSNTFIEGTDCGVFGAAEWISGNVEEADCFCYAFSECNKAKVTYDVPEMEMTSIIEITGETGSSCDFTVKQIFPDYPEGLSSTCNNTNIPREQKRGRECIELIDQVLNSIYDKGVCTGELTDEWNVSCEEICQEKGYETGQCSTPENMLCNSGSENYGGHLISCKQDDAFYPCCCSKQGDLWVSGPILHGEGFWDDEIQYDCIGSNYTACERSNLYFYLENSFNETVGKHPENIIANVYVDGQLYSEGLAVEMKQDPNSREFPPGKTLAILSENPFKDYELIPDAVEGHEICISIDINNYYEEADETNNEYCESFPAENIDLNVYNIYRESFFKRWIFELRRSGASGGCIPIESKIFVNGELEYERSKASHWSTDCSWRQGDGIEVPTDSIWTWLGTPMDEEIASGTYTVKVVIDPANKINETDETNNELTEIIEVS